MLDLIELEKSNEVSPIIEYSSKIREFSKFPPMVEVTLPKFISKPIDHEKLYSLFGHITSFSAATYEKVSLLNQLKPSVRELLDKPECLAIIKTMHARLRNVLYLDKERIWTSGEGNEIKCFNSKGSLVQKINTKSKKWPSGLAVDTDGIFCTLTG